MEYKSGIKSSQNEFLVCDDTMKIDILGTEYRIETHKVSEDSFMEEKSLAGYCGEENKLIVVADMSEDKYFTGICMFKECLPFVFNIFNRTIDKSFFKYLKEVAGITKTSIIYNNTLCYEKSNNKIDWRLRCE